MGSEHIFIGLTGDTPVIDKNNKLNWCPNSCTLASIIGKIRHKIADPAYKNVKKTKVITDDADLLEDIIRTINSRVNKRLIIICWGLLSILVLTGIIFLLSELIQWIIAITLGTGITIALLLELFNRWLFCKYLRKNWVIPDS